MCISVEAPVLISCTTANVRERERERERERDLLSLRKHDHVHRLLACLCQIKSEKHVLHFYLTLAEVALGLLGIRETATAEFEAALEHAQATQHTVIANYCRYVCSMK